MVRNILIIGATSAIAEEAARIYAKRGDRLFLVARNADRLHAIASDLSIRGASDVRTAYCDATRFAVHPTLINSVFEAFETIDIALLAHGVLPNQSACEAEFSAALAAVNANAIGTLSLLTPLANRMEAQGHGTIAVVTSVAGERGRAANYIYGASKSFVSTYLQGLRQRLHRSKVRVVDIRPGPIDTPMLANRDRPSPKATPQQIAPAIVRGIARGTPTLYLPGGWRWTMAMVRALPEWIFVRARR